MIDLKNTYIENDFGELRDLYLLAISKSGYDTGEFKKCIFSTIGLVDYGDDWVVQHSIRIGARDGIRKLTLSDLTGIAEKGNTEWVNGLPPVGVECEIKHKRADSSWAKPDFYKVKIMAYGNELFIIHKEQTCNDCHESVGEIKDYLFRPIETPEQKAAREELESAYELYKKCNEIESPSCHCRNLDEFKVMNVRKTWINIVRETGYQKPD